MRGYKSLPYRDEYRNIAHGAKRGEDEALVMIALYLSAFATSRDILIPAPNHCGRAVYTKRIAELISELTGAKVFDCLATAPHRPLYEDRDQKIEMSLLDTPISDGRLLFVDNVISTGKTYQAAKEVLPELSPLVYSNCNHNIWDQGLKIVH